MSDQTIQHPPIDAKLIANQHSGSRKFGPLLLTYNVDLTEGQASISGSLLGVSIGTRVFNLNNPTPAVMEGTISMYKAHVLLEAVPSERIMRYNITIECFGEKIAGGQGVLFDW